MKPMRAKNSTRKQGPQNTGTGSGSRPGASKIKIPDSAPKDMHGMGGRDKVKNKPLK